MIEQLVILGHTLGTCTGWDQTDDTEYVFYDFIPAVEYEVLLAGNLSFDWQAGQFYYYNEWGERKKSIDVSVLYAVPKG